MYRLGVKVTFFEEVLGTCSANPDVHAKFIASKSPNPETLTDEIAAATERTGDEKEAIKEVEEKQMTVFPKLEDGTPFIYDYQWKGFFKDTAKALKKISATQSSDMTAYRQIIDKNIFIEERKIPFVFPEYGELGNCQRPLRASTAQGERIALANSETVPAGSTVEFHVVILNDNNLAAVKEWFQSGFLMGFLQWRNSGKGKFVVDFISEEKTELTFLDPKVYEKIKGDIMTQLKVQQEELSKKKRVTKAEQATADDLNKVAAGL